MSDHHFHIYIHTNILFICTIMTRYMLYQQVLAYNFDNKKIAYS